jgi:DNA-binding FadR family transcriptional regulator
VVRGIVEMRSALAPDIARLAAVRAAPAQLEALDGVVAAMTAAGDLPALQGLAAEFWSHLVDAADNLAYRLAYNSLRATYDQCRELFTQVLADEFADLPCYRAIAAAVRARDPRAAEALARELIRAGERSIKTALRRLDAQLEGAPPSAPVKEKRR